MQKTKPSIRLLIYLLITLALYSTIAIAIGSWNPASWNKIRSGDFVVMQNWQEWGYLKQNRSVDGNILSIDKTEYGQGLGTHAYSEITIEFKDGFKTFSGACGIDMGACKDGSAVFRIFSENKLLFESPLLKAGDPAVAFNVPIDGTNRLKLVADSIDGRHCDHADWVDLSLK